MPEGIQLRVPEGTKFSPALLEALKTLLPNYDLEEYSLKPNYLESYKKRVDSLYAAFLFLMEAFPRSQKISFLSENTLKTNIDEFKKSYIAKMSKVNTVAAMQNNLSSFTAKLIDLIALGWEYTHENATELLNEAEQYVVMSNGRRDLATLTPFDLGNAGEYILQLDKTLPPYDQQVLDELTQIKALEYPKTPEWFRGLADRERHYMQTYFCNLNSNVANLVDDFDAFHSKWNSAKDRAEKIAIDLKQIEKGVPPIPRWFAKLSPHHTALMRDLAKEPIASIDNKLQKLKAMLVRGDYKDTLEMFIKLPQWYWVLPIHQQYFLQHVLKSKERIEDAVSFLSSRHRTLPMPANFAAHSTWVLNNKGETRQLYDPKFRSSHIATRDGIDLGWPEAVNYRHAQSNLTQVLSKASPKQTILFQTLISPVPIVSASVVPDGKLDKIAHSVVEDVAYKDKKIVFLNHPYNVANRFLYTVASAKPIVAFLKAVEPYAAKNPEVASLVAAYEAVLNSGAGSATIYDYVGRELFLSSLEQVICLTAGIYSYGSCVSGKDRKAIESIHTDAMFLYKEKYGMWPSFRDNYDAPQNRAKFVSLVADLYMTRHHQVHAGQNAPGSEALKTPDNYFPEDIAKEINARLGADGCLKDDDRVATNNEVRKISVGTKVGAGDGLSPSNKLLCKLVANQLGMNDCKKLYDALFLLLFNSGLIPVTHAEPQKSWSALLFSGSSSSAPDAIQSIRAVMDGTDTGDNVGRMTKIFEIVINPSIKVVETNITVKKLIAGLRGLIKSEDPKFNLEEAATKLEDEWTTLFKASKTEHSKGVGAHL